jgi:CzcA family heavy metal efflux pump
MIGIVKVALHRPLTFIVMAILIAIAGILAAIRTPVDIFPDIKIPVVAVAWQYTNLPPQEMANRIVGPYERVLTTTVNDIEHIESQSLPGIGIVKIYFQPGADIRTATAQVTSVSQTVLKQFPAGATPPVILNYSASTVPIVQLALSGEGLSEQNLFDLAQNQIRPTLVTVPGLAMPFPSGGKQRQIQVDLNPISMQAVGLSAQDVSTAIAAQNQINPAGFVKIGQSQYNVQLNNAPSTVAGLNDLPVKVVGGATIYMRDVAHVRDGNPPQQNIVHVNGRRSTLLTVLKNGATSTLSVIAGVKSALPTLTATLPPSLKVLLVGDQSLFVKAAVGGVIREGVIAAGLTSLMILLFLGSWRATIIIATSIPLAVLAAVAALAAFGETLNVMTLGGLALAVGILVDEGTVTIENIEWHLEQGKGVLDAIIDGSMQIVVPAFVSLLCICVVFLPMFFLPGVAGFLFVPMALSVIFAMIASFILSRTLVPTMAMYLLKPHEPRDHENDAPSRNPFVRFQHGFEHRFERLRAGYIDLLGRTLGARGLFSAVFMAVVVLSFGLVPLLGSNFFPSVDSGQIAMHVRTPVGTRIEDTAARFEDITRAVRQIIPADQLATITDNIGLPVSSINTVYNNSGTIGPQDGDMLVTLDEHHDATQGFVDTLRRELPRRFPGTTFAFLPADITSQILNFGAPAPIDVQISGKNGEANRAYARELMARMSKVAGIADVRIQQPARSPQLNIDADRSRIGQYGLTEGNVTNDVSNALAGSSQVAPAYFVDPKNGISYPIVAQAPEYLVGSLSDISNLPVGGANAASGTVSQPLGALATITRGSSPPVVGHYNLSPVIDIYAATQGRDLGAVAGGVQKIIGEMAAKAPKGTKVTIRGQYATMQTAFSGLGWGLAAAVLFIYLLIVVNFQSWTDPFVIITALPAALAGIIWMLFVTGTTLSVPALTGAIMCMGVATANSILVISFARERLAVHGDAIKAALEAGEVRIRPVLMTAMAMVIGMLPMALGMGEGGEQNAPLGRAVIGGLIFATIATLFFVPAVFSFAHRKAKPPKNPTGETPTEMQPSYA